MAYLEMGRPFVVLISGKGLQKAEPMKQKRAEMAAKSKTTKENFRQESLDAWKESSSVPARASPLLDDDGCTINP